ncbi:hypothetical protein BpHYR1_007657 [Brachionus plicatilis]|uniref:Uncharacterized protein n=1 Tax=Brachionus plicatilis TaxID=10195 RepID=A0A3M7T0D8_BRAPC|nr:hypothetical protein BpHYR1_007657 [Brachionus plicatilis]
MRNYFYFDEHCTKMLEHSMQQQKEKKNTPIEREIVMINKDSSIMSFQDLYRVILLYIFISPRN